MSVVHEIVLPDASPAYEWILGEAVQKVSPTRAHSLLQGIINDKITAWAGDRGDVGPEWRFRLLPEGSLECRPLVPDVAYISVERLAPLSDAEIEAPNVAPELVVEIISPDDKQKIRDAKRDVYLSAGVRVVLEVNPETRSFSTFGPDGEHFETRTNETWTHREFPGLELSLSEIFSVLRRKR